MRLLVSYTTLWLLSVRDTGDKRQCLSLYLFRLNQELVSPETDGQFVIGLRDGEGAATSRVQIFDLKMETVSNTLMIIGYVNEIDAM